LTQTNQSSEQANKQANKRIKQTKRNQITKQTKSNNFKLNIMGRITIFTQEDCKSSLLVKSLLNDHDVPYHEISLSNHPERRADMITLTHSLVTPQVFFNNLHVGGFEELKSRFEAYTKDITDGIDNNIDNSIDNSTSSEYDNVTSDSEDDQHAPNRSHSHRSSHGHISSHSRTPTRSNQERQPSSILERISSSVLSRPSPTHEIKLRTIPQQHQYQHQPSTSDITYQQNKQMDSNLWKERIQQYDTFQLKFGPNTSQQLVLSIPNLTRHLCKIIPQRKIFMYPKFHSKSFKGSQAVDSFVQDLDFITTKPDAIAFGNMLLRLGVFHCLVQGTGAGTGSTKQSSGHSQYWSEEDRVEEEEKVIPTFHNQGIYRLQPFHNQDIMNKFRIWTNQITDKHDPQPLMTLSNLTKRLHAAISETTTKMSTSTSKGTTSESFFQTMQQNANYQYFEEHICLLQLVDLYHLHEKERFAFFINVYNLMFQHALILGRYNPISSSFYSKPQYLIGGHVFSLDDIYHGILRNNEPHPKTQQKMFDSQDDPRLEFKFVIMNPRIHFALLCNYVDTTAVPRTGDTNMNKNTNPMNINPMNRILSFYQPYEFHQEAILHELFIVTQQAFLLDTRITLQEDLLVVNLPKFLKDYIPDFVKSYNGYGSSSLLLLLDNSELVKAISKYMIGERRETLDRMIWNSDSYSVRSLTDPAIMMTATSPMTMEHSFIKVKFSNGTKHSRGSFGLGCLWNCANPNRNLYGKFSSNGGNGGGGGFPQSANADEEIHLLQDIHDDDDEDDSHYDFLSSKSTITNHPELDAFSEASGSVRDLFDIMSTASWSLGSFDKLSFDKLSLPEKLEEDQKIGQGSKRWEKFPSVSFSMSATSTPPRNQDQQKQQQEQREVLVTTPPTPNGKTYFKSVVCSPSTTRTESITSGSPFSTQNGSSLSSSSNTKELELLGMPDFPGDTSNCADSVDCSSTMDEEDNNSNGVNQYNDPPMARRVEKEGLFRKDKNEMIIKSTIDEGKPISNYMSVFFPPKEFCDFNNEDENQKSVCSGDGGDAISYMSRSWKQGSFDDDIVTHNTDFENLYNSSMASI